MTVPAFDDPVSEQALREIKGLREDLKAHAASEPERTKRIVRSAIKSAVITSGAIVGIVSAGLVAWSNVKQAQIAQNTQLLIAAQQKVEQERPSTEQGLINAYAEGYKKARAEERERTAPPLNKAPDRLAAQR